MACIQAAKKAQSVLGMINSLFRIIDKDYLLLVTCRLMG